MVGLVGLVSLRETSRVGKGASSSSDSAVAFGLAVASSLSSSML